MGNIRSEVTYPSSNKQKKKAERGFTMPSDAELEASGMVKYKIEGTECYGWCKPEDLPKFKDTVEEKYIDRHTYKLTYREKVAYGKL